MAALSTDPPRQGQLFFAHGRNVDQNGRLLVASSLGGAGGAVLWHERLDGGVELRVFALLPCGWIGGDRYVGDDVGALEQRPGAISNRAKV
jgi:hypothetical protein